MNNPYESIVKDVRNFARYLKVVDPKGGYINFEPRNYQIGLLKRYQRNPYTIVKHTRQCGATTTTAIYLLWHALTKSNQNIIISSDTLRSSYNIVEDIKRLYGDTLFKNNYGWELIKENKSSIEFANGSTISALAATETRFQEMKIDVLYIDNCSLISDSVLLTINPMINSGGKIIITSCPTSKKYNFFENLFEKATSGISKFKAFNIKGFQVPGRDKEWMLRMKEKIGVENFKREFNWY